MPEVWAVPAEAVTAAGGGHSSGRWSQGHEAVSAWASCTLVPGKEVNEEKDGEVLQNQACRGGPAASEDTGRISVTSYLDFTCPCRHRGQRRGAVQR